MVIFELKLSKSPVMWVLTDHLSELKLPCPVRQTNDIFEDRKIICIFLVSRTRLHTSLRIGFAMVYK
jgi:hypothetical protein